MSGSQLMLVQQVLSGARGEAAESRPFYGSRPRAAAPTRASMP